MSTFRAQYNPPFNNKKNPKRIYLLSYITISLIVGSLLYFTKGSVLNIARWLSHPYCSPVLICMASFLFLFFTKIQIKCSVINWIASSTLAIYLLHENRYFMTIWDGFVDWYPFIENVFVNNNCWMFLLILMCGVIGIMASAILIDKIRLIILKPIYKLFDKIYSYIQSTITRRYYID